MLKKPPMAAMLPGVSTVRAAVRLVIVGHVDHGKSTLIGRLMHDTGSLPDGKLEAIRGMSERRGMPFEWSFLLDALQAERDQGITIDTSQIRFRTPHRDVLLIDAPGHVEFLKNMVTGAAQADAALLVIDAAEGVREQSRRHGFLLHLLGVANVTVIVNKMDKVAYSEAEFRNIETEFRGYLGSLGVTPGAFIPVAAREGDMIVDRGSALGWYTGETVVEAIDGLEPARPPQDLALRIPVQDVYKFDDRRIVAGRVEAGRIHVGDEIVFWPSGKTAHVQSLETWPAPAAGQEIQSLSAGASASLVLDRQLFVERGEIATTALARTPVARVLKARIFCEYAWHAAFIRHLLRRPSPKDLINFKPEFTVVNLPSFRADPAKYGVRSETVIACDFVRRLVLIGGSSYAGETKKSVFSFLNYLMPEHNVMPMHCSANVSHDGESAVFFGLSGTGKTTLSADPNRILLGDDEHGWSEHGIYNFEGGCYAKTIRLSA